MKTRNGNTAEQRRFEAEPACMEQLEPRIFLSSAPVAPTVAATFLPTTNQVQVAWSKPSGATAYTVYRSTVNNANSAAIIASGVSATSFTDKSPNVSTTYYYWVKAFSGSLGSSYSRAVQCTDTDKSVVRTISVSADKLFTALNFLSDLKSDLDTITTLAFGVAPSVTFRCTSLSGSITESEIVTSTGTIVSGKATGTIYEAGNVTAQISAGNLYGAAVAVGVEVDETLSLKVAATYTSSGWSFDPGASLAGTVSAYGFGRATSSGYTVQVNFNSPTASFGLNLSSTGAQGTVSVAGPVTVTYSVTGPHNYKFSGTLYQSPSLRLPIWTFNIGNIKGLL